MPKALETVNHPILLQDVKDISQNCLESLGNFGSSWHHSVK